MQRVSIIVPIYNVEKHLDRCMQSLLHQTLREIELILVDDGSPDRCPELCDEYARQDSRIKVIHQKNGGLGFARNSGLEIATGEYVAFCDSDDFVERNMYASLYEEAKASDADVVFSNFFIETRKGQWIENKEVSERTEWRGKEIEAFMLDMVASAPYMKQERRYQMSVWHSIYRRSIIEDHAIRFYSEREVLSEDFPFQMEYLKHAQKVVYIPQAFYHYCSNGGSLTHSFNPDKFGRVKVLYDIMAEQLKDIEGSQKRLDRFYIGYMRTRTIELATSDTAQKCKVLKEALQQSSLAEIKKRYPYKCLSLYQRLFYWLSVNKRTISLVFLSKVISFIK